jgi:hypothetical protein
MHFPAKIQRTTWEEIVYAFGREILRLPAGTLYVRDMQDLLKFRAYLPDGASITVRIKILS